MISSGKSLTGITVIFMYDISVLGFSRESNHRKHGDDGDQKKIDISIPDNCHFLYANAISGPGKGTPKKCVN